MAIHTQGQHGALHPHPSASLILKPTREKSLRNHHPWVFSGAVDRIEGDALPGETVEIFSSPGKWLAYAAYSPHSQIVARVWSFEQSEEISPEFFRNRLKKAIKSCACKI